MGKDIRATYKRRHSYATKSNRTKAVKTPGGSLVLHTLKKRSKGPRCGDTKTALHGIKKLKSKAYKNVNKRQKTVSRPYGGTLSAGAVRDRCVFIRRHVRLAHFIMTPRLHAEYICLMPTVSFVRFWSKSRRLWRKCLRHRRQMPRNRSWLKQIFHPFTYSYWYDSSVPLAVLILLE